MYEIVSCDWQHDKDNILKLNEIRNTIKVSDTKIIGLRGYAFNESMYVLALSMAVLNYNHIDYVLTFSGEKNCVLVLHNYIWGSELKLYYQNEKGQECERTIECFSFADKSVEVFKVRHTKTGRRIAEWVGTFRRVKE